MSILIAMKTVLAFGVIAGLFVIVILLYILNRKTPLPKGCEDIKIDQGKCASCSNSACGMKQRIQTQKEGETIDKNQ